MNLHATLFLVALTLASAMARESLFLGRPVTNDAVLDYDNGGARSESQDQTTSFEPNFCRTQTLIGNFSLHHNGVKVYEYPMEWYQDNEQQKLRISIKGVSDMFFSKYGRFTMRQAHGPKFACFTDEPTYDDLCQFYYYVKADMKANDHTFHAHPLPISQDLLLPQVAVWKIIFSATGDHFLGMVGEVNHAVQYTFVPSAFHEARAPRPEDVRLPENCFVEQNEQATKTATQQLMQKRLMQIQQQQYDFS